MTLFADTPRAQHSTKTEEGDIPHRMLMYRSRWIEVPVKIELRKATKGSSLIYPVRRGSGLVYALPSGGEHVA
jgi:hypothetical protein